MVSLRDRRDNQGRLPASSFSPPGSAAGFSAVLFFRKRRLFCFTAMKQGSSVKGIDEINLYEL